MITNEMIKKKLTNLYSHISFEAGKEPSYNKLKELFLDEAVVFEYLDSDYTEYRVKRIEEHIEEMYDIFEKYPVIKGRGFKEQELSNKNIISGPVALIVSEYKKEYFNGKHEVITVGTNNITMMLINEDLKIVSIGWYENI
ncbi:hypothetical protein [Alkaliphilus peptidifermentans]|uniref:SnoaL-like domain-containing protein n=1 Tax=Alkaliphilus peptidifermentans DSM 18978 TaxID=1120976 RepID=A0A1G5GRM6_9FIRM|nr:hypothetical protein [Alkaliphilus peptidifermentans]SCY54009.1 hypothetical protein SAMN03080606_01749 [Alkaliphilus peptidifermentans DSM 18978]